MAINLRCLLISIFEIFSSGYYIYTEGEVEGYMNNIMKTCLLMKKVVRTDKRYWMKLVSWILILIFSIHCKEDGIFDN